MQPDRGSSSSSRTGSNGISENIGDKEEVDVVIPMNNFKFSLCC